MVLIPPLVLTPERTVTSRVKWLPGNLAAVPLAPVDGPTRKSLNCRSYFSWGKTAHAVVALAASRADAEAQNKNASVGY